MTKTVRSQGHNNYYGIMSNGQRAPGLHTEPKHAIIFLSGGTIVQLVVKKILEAIYEPGFLNCMYGFRLNRGCHDAIREMHHRIQNEWINYVVDAGKSCQRLLESNGISLIFKAVVKQVRMVYTVFKRDTDMFYSRRISACQYKRLLRKR